jgi:hypothetical protein
MLLPETEFTEETAILCEVCTCTCKKLLDLPEAIILGIERAVRLPIFYAFIDIGGRRIDIGRVREDRIIRADKCCAGVTLKNTRTLFMSDIRFDVLFYLRALVCADINERAAGFGEVKECGDTDATTPCITVCE